jgi:Trk K+ transport system NAD-binding subunit
MVGGRVTPNAPITAGPLGQLRLRQAEWGWVVAALVREGRTIVAHGDTVVRPGDHALLMTTDDRVDDATRLLGLKRRQIERVIIVGATRLAEITADLMAEAGLSVVIIDEEPARCRYLAERHPFALIINGDPTDPDVHSELEMSPKDVVLALSGWDEINLMSCLVAKASGAGLAISRFNRIAYVGLLAGIGIDAAVSSRLIAASAILRFVRQGHVEQVATFSDTDAEAIEIEIEPGSKAVDRSVMELDLPLGVIIGGISRKRHHFRPRRIDRGPRRRSHHLLRPAPRYRRGSRHVHGMTTPARGLLKTVAYVLGSILVFIAVAMILAGIVSVVYGEFDTALWIGVAAAFTAAAGYGTRRTVTRPETITVKQGFATVGLAWFVFSLFGALPYVLTGPSPTSPTPSSRPRRDSPPPAPRFCPIRRHFPMESSSGEP